MNPSFASPLPSDPTQDSVSRDFKHVIAVKREAEGQALILLNNLRKGEDILLGFGFVNSNLVGLRHEGELFPLQYLHPSNDEGFFLTPKSNSPVPTAQGSWKCFICANNRKFEDMRPSLVYQKQLEEHSTSQITISKTRGLMHIPKQFHKRLGLRVACFSPGRAEFFVTHPVLAHGASWIKGLVV
ncbi:hypothetical protein LENED_008655 [Lentinula edodes]|uniref:Uncharacterized protein n=1 Tax=Lentinula edodes TaxID=5353 RepID=A0A1Q3EHN9_LENED|nr:hypothetical protein LENED_008655 [Lentinula edodes]